VRRLQTGRSGKGGSTSANRSKTMKTASFGPPSRKRSPQFERRAEEPYPQNDHSEGNERERQRLGRRDSVCAQQYHVHPFAYAETGERNRKSGREKSDGTNPCDGEHRRVDPDRAREE